MSMETLDTRGKCQIMSYGLRISMIQLLARSDSKPPQACAHLRTLLKSWHPNQRRLLFATRNGTPWDQNLLLKRKFRPLLRALGIQVPRGNGVHAFRHANATLMNSFGASQKLRQQRLGHADGSPVTDTIYTHVISEDGKRIAAPCGLKCAASSRDISVRFTTNFCTNSRGTGSTNCRFASGERSLPGPKNPTSFSTCTIRTVCCSPSLTRTCPKSAAKARLSHLALSVPNVERISSGVLSAAIALGDRFVSDLTQSGAYSENAFLQLPNHNSTR